MCPIEADAAEAEAEAEAVCVCNVAALASIRILAGLISYHSTWTMTKVTYKKIEKIETLISTLYITSLHNTQ